MEVKGFRTILFSCGIAAFLISGLAVGAFAQAATGYDYDEYPEGCTTVIAVGTATVDGKTRTGQNSDGFAHKTGLHPARVVKIKIDEKTGIKTIGELNDRGVARQGAARSPLSGMKGGASTFGDPNEAYIVEYAFVKKDYPEAGDIKEKALFAAHTAKEAVDLCVKGLPEGSYHITGPLRNQAVGHANAYLAPELLQLQSSAGFSRVRGKRVHELLQERDLSRNEEESTVLGKISTLYLFRVLRTHDTPWGFDSSWVYPSDATGNIGRWSYRGISRNAVIKEISSEYPDLLSIYWTTPHFAPFSPFLPFHIGLTEIPPTFAEGEANESDIFRELFNAIAYKMSYADDVQRFWESFDFQTVSELQLLEIDVTGLVDKGKVKAKGLLDGGDRERVEKVLYNFSNAKCELAVSYAKQLIEIIVAGRPITDIRVDTSLPNRPTWE